MPLVVPPSPPIVVEAYPLAVQELNKCLELFLSHGPVTVVQQKGPKGPQSDTQSGDKESNNNEKVKRQATNRDSPNEELVVDDLSENENKGVNVKKVLFIC